MEIRDVKVIIFLGGPSSERDISLDSARTFFDSLWNEIPESQISLVFVSQDKGFYELSPSWLYANKIDDFSRQTNSYDNLDQDLKKLDESSLYRLVMAGDALCSFIHGEFGEDGKLRDLLGRMGREAILGSSSKTLKLLFNKFETYKKLDAWEYPTIERRLVDTNSEINIAEITNGFPPNSDNLFVVKPNRGGSSDGVSICLKPEIANAIKHASTFDSEVIVEEKINGREFSIILIQDFNNEIISFFPTEIKLESRDNPGHSGNFYSRIKKYLPGSGAEHQTPILIDREIIEDIRNQAKELFIKFKVEDWARFDGFLCSDGKIIWSDLNGIPGYGIDSFFFQQASLHMLDQQAISLLLLQRVLQKEHKSIESPNERRVKKKKISVIGGGVTSEKNVSRMSWLNVIQKLEYLRKYDINRIFMTGTGDLWKIPHFVSLQHTVKEIEQLITHHQNFLDYYQNARIESEKWSPGLKSLATLHQFVPERVTLKKLANETDFVFNALHGGMGEDGTFQKSLDDLGIPYNGSRPSVSSLCINKFRTCQELTSLNIPKFRAPRQKILNIKSLKEWIINKGVEISNQRLFQFLKSPNCSINTLRSEPVYREIDTLIKEKICEWKKELRSPCGIVIKPINDGCSSGVLVSTGKCDEISSYFLYLFANFDEIPRCLLGGRFLTVSPEMKFKMPQKSSNELLVEEYLGDDLDAENTEFTEITAGVVGKRGEMIALLPSKTPSDFGALTLEEKFCKGIGVNLISPSDFDQKIVESIRQNVSYFANQLGLDGYARIDLMYRKPLDQLILIEVNTLPSLSVATVLFTQAYITKELNLSPSEFIDHIIDLGYQRVEDH